MERVALSVDASHGGRIVAVGDFSVELVALGDGLVAAWVLDASGKAHVQGDLDLNINVVGADVKFAWDAPSLSYRAKVAANVDIYAEPIQIALNAKGRAHFAFVPALDAKARANLNANLKANLNANLNAKANADAVAKLGADAKAKLEIKPPKIEVKAPSVNLNVQKSASASAGAGASTKTTASTNTQAKAGTKAGAGFSFGTK
jgi:hypothetical protein